MKVPQKEKDENMQDRQADGPTKSYHLILEQKIEQGLAEFERSNSGLFLSALSAGLDLGFSVFLMAVLYSRFSGILTNEAIESLMAIVYSTGFLLVIFGRSELFTEHTALAVFPVLAGRSTIRSLLRVWMIIYMANLLGAAAFSLLLLAVGPSLNIIKEDAFVNLAESLIKPSWYIILLSGVVAGWLMGLVSWLVTAGKETIGQVFFVMLLTATIGFGKLHHCIVGSIEILPAVYLGLGVSFWQYLYTLLWMTFGNIIGGVFFVALIKYSHTVRG
ncbi:MAG: formate/nitrite transporter family protein [Candidatus Abyssobacteria bacterium SURF_5]|uniref:Formate/nitrite transporter family protein n=1 Tax=Abyssobacteria bacterium (strain SURF_5) TaxID=2093360 RepID=A0A3A4P4B3_ABYX5|nr:MAG: formate/nitrite transporter family protein [Candidatus Abyssubacteria bacterium SURF_5]